MRGLCYILWYAVIVILDIQYAERFPEHENSLSEDFNTMWKTQ